MSHHQPQQSCSAAAGSRFSLTIGTSKSYGVPGPWAVGRKANHHCFSNAKLEPHQCAFARPPPARPRRLEGVAARPGKPTQFDAQASADRLRLSDNAPGCFARLRSCPPRPAAHCHCRT
eukprot:15477046-Alexandrium_andersonii.AAC.1